MNLTELFHFGAVIHLTKAGQLPALVATGLIGSRTIQASEMASVNVRLYRESRNGCVNRVVNEHGDGYYNCISSSQSTQTWYRLVITRNDDICEWQVIINPTPIKQTSSINYINRVPFLECENEQPFTPSCRWERHPNGRMACREAPTSPFRDLASSPYV